MLLLSLEKREPVLEERLMGKHELPCDIKNRFLFSKAKNHSPPSFGPKEDIILPANGLSTNDHYWMNNKGIIAMWFPLTSTTKIFWESSKNCTFKCSILGEAVGLRAGSECCGCCDRKGAFSRNFSLSWRQCARVPPPPPRHPHSQQGTLLFARSDAHHRACMLLHAGDWEHLDGLFFAQRQIQLDSL